MNKLKLILLALLASNHLLAANWQLGAGVSYADVSGMNFYQASNNSNTQDTKNLSVPYLFVTKGFNDKFSVNYRYSYYSSLEGHGTANTSNIFGSGGVSLQVITDYSIDEKIHENSLGLDYTLVAHESWSLLAGPVISFSSSTAKFTLVDNPSQIKELTETEVSLGAEILANYKISEKASLNLNYRYSSMGDKNINLIGLGFSINL
jgi:opacity protein-like surface antigen